MPGMQLQFPVCVSEEPRRLRPPTRHIVRVSATAPLFLALAISAGIAQQCAGSTLRGHRLGGFDFITNSRAQVTQSVATLFACVGNRGQRDLKVNWYIPQYQYWVLPGEAVEIATRYAVPADLSPLPIEGCIEYTYLGDRTSAHFVGTSSEVRQAEEENRLNCRNVPTLAEPGGLLEGIFEKIIVPFRFFFPSNRNKPEATMLEASGNLSVYRSGKDEKYTDTTILSYSLRRYKDRPEGDPAAIKVRANLGRMPKELAPFFEKPVISRQIVDGSEHTVLAVSVPTMKPAQVTRGVYEFVDTESQVAAELPFPIFISP
jgi:hypothetical protein